MKRVLVIAITLINLHSFSFTMESHKRKVDELDLWEQAAGQTMEQSDQKTRSRTKDARRIKALKTLHDTHQSYVSLYSPFDSKKPSNQFNYLFISPDCVRYEIDNKQDSLFFALKALITAEEEPINYLLYANIFGHFKKEFSKYPAAAKDEKIVEIAKNSYDKWKEASKKNSFYPRHRILFAYEYLQQLQNNNNN